MRRGVGGSGPGRVRPPLPAVAFAAILTAGLQTPAPSDASGERLLLEGRYQEALSAFDRALADDAEDAAGHHGRGRALVGLLRYREAAAAFERAASLEPRSGAAWADLVVVRTQLGRRAEALEAADALERIGGEASDADRLRAARALRKIEAYDQARRLLAVEPPAGPEAHRELGLLAAAAGDCAEAIPQLERAGRSAEVELELGRCHEAAGRAAEAIDRFRAALAADPALGAARFRLGNALLRAGRAEEGRALLEDYERFRQWQRRSQLLLAMLTSGTLSEADALLKTRELVALYLEGAALDEAASLIGSGLVRYPDDPELRTARAQWLLATGDAPGARAALDAIVTEPDPPAAALRLSARLYLGAGQIERALADYRRAVAASDPPRATLLQEHATALALAGHHEASESAFREAIARDPSLASARADLALLLESLGREGEAEAAYRDAVAIDPRFVPALLGLSGLRLAAGDPSEAERLLRTAVVLEPRSAELRRSLARALRAQGRIDEAEEELRIAIGLER